MKIHAKIISKAVYKSMNNNYLIICNWKTVGQLIFDIRKR